MSFYKDYPNRKDQRKQYRPKDGRSVDTSCKNHQACTHCASKRTFFDRKKRVAADHQLKEYFNSDQVDYLY